MADPQTRRSIISGMVGNTAPTVDMRSIGGSGLNQSAGFIFEEQDARLRGVNGARIFKEMGTSDPTCSTILRLIYQIVSGVKWYVQGASEMPEDREASDFLEQCLSDMDKPFAETIVENMSMVQFGYSLHEIVYKKRTGKAAEPWMRSKFSDGRIGWRGLPMRSQTSLYRWGFSEDGTLDYVEQQPAPHYQTIRIPMEKLLLFRTWALFNNPEGVSMLRCCHEPWTKMRAIAEFEAIGIERDLAGLPIALCPAQIMADDATSAEKALFHEIQQIVSRVRNNQQAGVAFMSDRDEKGNLLFEFKLLTSGGAKSFDTDKVISRYKSDIARAALADFIMLGSSAGSSGSWAMHSDKTKMFVQSLQAYLQSIKNVYNEHAIPRLFELNTFRVTELPKIQHTPLESVDLAELSSALLALTQAGMPIFPNPEAEARIMDVLGLPKSADPDRIVRQAMAPTVATNDGKAPREILGDAPPGDGHGIGPKTGPDSVARPG